MAESQPLFDLDSQPISQPVIPESGEILPPESQVNSQPTFPESESESQVPQISQSAGNSANVKKPQRKRRDRFILHSISEKQLYVRNKTLSNGSVAYTCQEKTCKARIFEKNGVYSFSNEYKFVLKNFNVRCYIDLRSEKVQVAQTDAPSSGPNRRTFFFHLIAILRIETSQMLFVSMFFNVLDIFYYIIKRFV